MASQIVLDSSVICQVEAAPDWNRVTLVVDPVNAATLENGSMYFAILGNIEDIEVIAIGSGIRELARLQKQFGLGRWRKLKGTANVQLVNGHIRRAQVHWYEAHGIGKRKMKIKRFID